MNHPALSRLIAVLGFAIVLAGSAAAQAMLDFPTDSVIAESCTNPSPQPRLFGHNPSGVGFTLAWREVIESFPASGFATMIIDGRQFLPQQPGGSVMLSDADSVEFVFEVYPESMSPGDTALYQILAFNPEDSAGTAVLLTSLVACPATTRIEEAKDSPAFVVYPNPAHGHVNFGLDARMSSARIDIYDFSGERISTLPASEAGARMDVHDWPAGAYIVCLVGNDRILDRRALVVIP